MHSFTITCFTAKSLLFYDFAYCSNFCASIPGALEYENSFNNALKKSELQTFCREYNCARSFLKYILSKIFIMSKCQIMSSNATNNVDTIKPVMCNIYM